MLLNKNKLYPSLVIIGLWGLCSQTVLAGTQGLEEKYRLLSTLTIGSDSVEHGHSQLLTLLPPFEVAFHSIGRRATPASLGAFIGLERPFGEKFQLQLGVSGYVDEPFQFKGEVWQFALPEFNNLTYRYKIHHTRFMLEGKLLTNLTRPQSLHPYLSWGLGAGFNRANSYYETPLILEAIPMSPFISESKTRLSWGAGLGFDYSINHHVRVGVGYQFTDLGAATLGPTPAAQTSQTLSETHLYANQLRFQLGLII